MSEQTTTLRQVVPSPAGADLEQTEQNLTRKHLIGASLDKDESCKDDIDSIPTTHAYIEADFDAMMLERKVAKSSIDKNRYGFVRSILATSKSSLELVSAMFSVVVDKVYNEAIPKKAFSRCVRDMRLLNLLLYSSKKGKRNLAAKIENYVLTGSFKNKVRQRDKNCQSSVFSNSKKNLWPNPYTGEACNKSFDDLFAHAINEAAQTIELYQKRAPAQEISKGLDFSGRP